jgi:FolB domain-containing protein
MDKITIQDLEVSFRIGVPDRERAHPQRLLITIEMDADVSAAAATDVLGNTIDYFAVAQRIRQFGRRRRWRLIERLAADLAGLILTEFKPAAVTVEVKKFALPEAAWVSVSVSRP